MPRNVREEIRVESEIKAQKVALSTFFDFKIIVHICFCSVMDSGATVLPV